MRPRAGWLALVLASATSCCLFGGNGKPPIDPVEPGNLIVKTFEEVAKLKNTAQDLEEAFVTAELFRRAFDLRAAAAYPNLKEEFRIRIGGFKPLFEDPGGRLILDEAARLLHHVALEADEKILRSAALKRLTMAFSEKGQRPTLRSLPSGANASELRDRLLEAVYRLLACAFAREFDAAAEGEVLLAPMILVYADALTRLAESASVRPEIREILIGSRQQLLADPSKLQAVRVGVPVRDQLKEAVDLKDRAVVQRAPGGSQELALAYFIQSLAHFALAAELASAEARGKLPELDNVPLILNEIELMTRKHE